jgi:hypothetical protein
MSGIPYRGKEVLSHEIKLLLKMSGYYSVYE